MPEIPIATRLHLRVVGSPVLGLFGLFGLSGVVGLCGGFLFVTMIFAPSSASVTLLVYPVGTFFSTQVHLPSPSSSVHEYVQSLSELSVTVS